jgi:Cys-rich protein (TIGR01571 family)
VLLPALAPCVVYGRNARRWDALDRTGRALSAADAADPCGYECAGHACLSALCLGACLAAQLRGRVRARYGIAGSAMEDVGEAVALWPCQLHQEARELELEERCVRGCAQRWRRRLSVCRALAHRPGSDDDDDSGKHTTDDKDVDYAAAARAARGSAYTLCARPRLAADRACCGWNPFVPTYSDVSNGAGCCCGACTLCCMCCCC